MRASEKMIKVIVLELTEDEAHWLHGVMQNPLWGEHPDNDTEYDRAMRRKFFDATTQDY